MTRQEGVRAPPFLFYLTFSGGYKSPVSHLPILAFIRVCVPWGAWHGVTDPGPWNASELLMCLASSGVLLFGLMNPKESWSGSWKQSLVVGTHTSLWYFVSFAHKNQIRDENFVIDSRSIRSLGRLVLQRASSVYFYGMVYLEIQANSS